MYSLLLVLPMLFGVFLRILIKLLAVGLTYFKVLY